MLAIDDFSFIILCAISFFKFLNKKDTISREHLFGILLYDFIAAIGGGGSALRQSIF